MNAVTPNQTLANVTSIQTLSQHIVKVCLQPESPASYLPGQYLSVVMGDNDNRPFSIANCPQASGEIELHIGVEPGNHYASEVVEHMRNQGQVAVQIGLGNAHLRADEQKPIILLAGGTGFSYTNAILQQLIQDDYQHPYFLYWGTRTFDNMYAYEALNALTRRYPHFRFVPVLDTPAANWQGRSGWVHKAVMHDFASLEDYQVYVAGRFEMAGVAREDFKKHGLRPENLYGDAYAFI